ncbi:hypothetical protein SEA_NICOLETERA_85 [Mycobacterium phage NicoleTera]|nr:hypothetical protein SEA_NICOLETERA_85 [Mycobacterium phage NicoleTera]
MKKRTKKKLKKHGVTVAIAFVTTVFTMALGSPAKASATELRTVDGIDYPVCVEEDCSDQPGQIGIWIDPDTGNQWLSVGETSYRIER